jgi:NADH dehydrogenase (ubiquinone) 1 beta subcomplex subunit 6
MYLLGCTVSYYGMYHANDWTHTKGWKMMRSKVAIVPGDPEWPHNTSQIRTKDNQYYNMGFNKSPI